MKRSARCASELNRLAIKCALKQLYIAIKVSSVENGFAVYGPHWYVAASAMEIGNIEKLGHAAVAVSVSEFPQPITIGLNDIGMTVVMLSRYEHQPLAVGRPRGCEVKRVACADVFSIQSI